MGWTGLKWTRPGCSIDSFVAEVEGTLRPRYTTMGLTGTVRTGSVFQGILEQQQDRRKRQYQGRTKEKQPVRVV